MTFYRVRRLDTLEYYNPDKPGDRVNPTFDRVGKKYYGSRGLVNARQAVKFCASPINDHWRPIKKKTPIKTEIRQFEEVEIAVGTVQ